MMHASSKVLAGYMLLELTYSANSNTNFPLKAVSMYWCKRVEKYLLLLKFLAVSIHSSTFQGLYTQEMLMHAKPLNTWHASTGKGRHIPGCTLRIKNTSLLWTL